VIKFLFGVAIGFFLGSKLNKWLGQAGSERQAADLLEKANSVLAEIRRVLDETRKQAGEKAGQVRERVEEKAGQVRERVEETAGQMKARAEGKPGPGKEQADAQPESPPLDAAEPGADK
jgi:ABC-type transporter Mla subunit MlaD